MAKTLHGLTDRRWIELFREASDQAGYFTTAQAVACGISLPLLTYHADRDELLSRVQRGIYRVKFFRKELDEDLVVCFLWSDRRAVIARETALYVHGLISPRPAAVQLLFKAPLRPSAVVPSHVETVVEELDDERDVEWTEFFPVTTPLRTLHDCAFVERMSDSVYGAVLDIAVSDGLISARDGKNLAKMAREVADRDIPTPGVR